MSQGYRETLPISFEEEVEGEAGFEAPVPEVLAPEVLAPEGRDHRHA
ncbi:MAG: hypothetical protein GDA49_12920 [Rhodospirillales bacterium]|nr:hypothetical protein [Rhodospirillales bacterium]